MTEAAERRTNRRGAASRESMLEAALHALASGEPGSVSGNRIAKDAGATWGTVKYQFGDIDGLWAAVLRFTAERRGELPSRAAPHGPLAVRVSAILDVMYDGLTATDSRAIENLRAALPRDRAELERLFPQTASELASWQRTWIEACQKAFADLDVDPARVREVALFIPGAMRGITSERQLGSYIDLDEARRGLSNAIVAYLEASRLTPDRNPTPVRSRKQNGDR
ncbi:TetR/AcrR family transcriptional regulator [Mycolicibacterium fluoranthenivorans]|uniref:DNA-binding transcriptional regulator YbjK n=1 Tax=Mycolicibacterium fluoranthenivorans TaxID=258505 RepID=A0A1G4WFD3_9MYCO|nr:TetR family transcriptional regulator [Mycolicibacterium fluoranthenivorans]SCX21923.1 DNA-binding transcriptional regulator YbjK [Mycolicibacterium fluoranthenivorans]